MRCRHWLPYDGLKLRDRHGQCRSLGVVLVAQRALQRMLASGMETPRWPQQSEYGDRTRGHAEPEILPPGAMPEPDYQRTYAEGMRGEYDAPPVAVRRRRPGWQLAPASYVLLGVNIAVYLVMVFNGVSPTAPSGGSLIHYGANVGIAVVAFHEWWRLITATFVHAGIIHLATNMWCLYNLGLLGEPLLGSLGVTLVYLLTGVAGNMLSVAVHPGVVAGGVVTDPGVIGVGASGAVFGIAGVLIPLLGSKLLPVDRTEVARLRRSVIYFAFLNFAIGFGTDVFHTPIRVDNMAHLGGFLSGVALGFVLVPKLGALRETWIQRQWIAFGGMLLLLLLWGRFLSGYWHG